ncbi:MAG: hypothetical protein COB15_12015 [Flavobacteriales bacterium]|nr:MAG: hypothetical protein COB15_12015 [Flavobacteriales bacterium]
MKNYYSLIIVILIIAIYIVSVNFGFILDDNYFIVNNLYVKKGLFGISDIIFKAPEIIMEEGQTTIYSYRPISHIIFATIYHYFGLDARIFHIINIAAFATTGLLLFKLLKDIIFKNYNILLSFIITLIFVSHPLTVESVANIKGLDDVLSLLFFIASFINIFKYLQKKESKTLIYSTLFFLLALFSKENTLMLIIIIPFISHYYYDHKIKTYLPLIISFSGVILIWILLKYKVNDGLLYEKPSYFFLNNNLILYPFFKRMIYAIYIQFEYVKLLFIPINLSCDYRFGYLETKSYSNIIIYALAYVIMLISILYKIIKKEKKHFQLFFLFYLIMIIPVSNILFLIGTPMAERLTLIPKLGLIIFIFISIMNLLKIDLSSFTFKNNKTIVSCCFIIVLTFSLLSFQRVKDWENMYKLISSSIDNNNSLYIKRSYIIELFNNKELNKSDRSKKLNVAANQLLKQVKDNPILLKDYYVVALSNFILNNYDKTITIINEANNFTNEDQLLLALSYEKLNNPNKSIAIYNELLKASKDSNSKASALYNKALLNYKIKNYDKALKDFLLVQEIDPNHQELQLSIALVYTVQEKYKQSLPHYENFLNKFPNNKQAKQNYIEISNYIKTNK